MKIVGIDAGLQGGITILQGDSIETYKMPLLKIGKKKSLDTNRILELLSNSDYIALEEQFILPTQGNKSNFTIGVNYGKLIALCEVSANKSEVVNSKVWQKFYPPLIRFKGNRAGRKREVMKIASRLVGKTISHDGIGDSVLIAFYAKKMLELKKV